MIEPAYPAWARRIEAAGLAARGAFHVTPDDGVPATAADDRERTLVLVGNTGSQSWPAFQRSPEHRDGHPHPLDRWSERVITALARELGAHALFPFKGPPYHPFLRWARRAEPVAPSPLGMLIHPEYGLWHAYRGALVADRRLHDLPPRLDRDAPCLSCPDQPCLSACPVDAFGAGGFDVDACAGHLQAGPNDCLDQGCLARIACPAGKAFQYVREQHRFHLAAFLRARTAETRSEDEGEGG